MALKIIRDDITHVTADAIVNTASPSPVVGAGTDAAIHEAAGPALLEARRAIGDIPVGSAAATPAFALHANYVLHTVSPVWMDGHHGEAALLRSAYDAALNLAASLRCASVAFPLMAAGSYGFPHDVALAVAIRAITDFLMDHDMTVSLVLFNGKAFGLAASLFDDLKSYIDDRYVAAQSKKEYRSDRRSFRRDRGALSSLSLMAGSAAAADEACTEAATPLPFAANAAPTGLADYLKQSEATFSEYLLDLLRERQGKDSEVYKRAEVSKQLFSKILSTKDYRPTKSTAIQLAIGLQLDLNGTQKLLEKAGYALTRSSKSDLVVQYYIERGIYSVTFINEALLDCGLPLLKTGLKS